MDQRGGNFLLMLGKFNEKYKRLVLFFTFLLVILSVWGMTKIKTETSVLEYFKKNSFIYQA